MFDTISRTEAVEAGAASRYNSGSDQMMQLLAAPAPQHCILQQSNVSVISQFGNGQQYSTIWISIFFSRAMFNFVWQHASEGHCRKNLITVPSSYLRGINTMRF
jgi:hypothetical protein